MINQFAAETLGTLVAFNRMGTDTYEKGRTVFVGALTEETVLDVEEKNKMHGDEILRIATEEGVIDAVLAAATVAEDKLGKMRELYIADQWSDAGILMKWNGFFEGGAIAQWGLLQGIAEGLAHEGLLALVDEAMNWHFDMLELAEGHLEAIGQGKVIVE